MSICLTDPTPADNTIRAPQLLVHWACRTGCGRGAGITPNYFPPRCTCGVLMTYWYLEVSKD